ncbi:MAG: PTS sugar transporter subunit IIA [Anaerostipes sp.]|nr:PTS sugar transporter subunit IIA [Anaerostipes sp.]
MNRRSNKILNKLILGEKENILELATDFQVQERTIRAEIKELNEDLKNSHLPEIITNIDGDVWIENVRNIDLGEFQKFILKYDFYTYYLSKNERETILAMMLLNAKSYTTIDRLGERVGVSRNTMIRALAELKNWFSDNDMGLVSQVRKGYVVEATEMKIRNGILRLLELNGEQQLYKSGYNLSVFWKLLLREVDPLDAFQTVRQFLIEEEENQQVFLTDYSFLEATIELLISINRIYKGKLLPKLHQEEMESLKESSKYEFSKRLFVRLGEEYKFQAPEQEVLNYTACLRGKSYLKNNVNKLDMFDVRILIGEIVYQISNSFGIDFYLDFSLYDLLVDHMRSAVHRLQNGEILSNPLCDELERIYPNIFKIVQKQIQPLEDYIGKSFSKDEMSFMVLYFASVIEKDKAEDAKRKIVAVALVCATGRGTAQLMLARLKCLDGIIEVVNVSSAHNMKEIENSGAEMIVSTVPISGTQLPHIQVKTPMLNDNDICDIQIMAMKVRNEERKRHQKRNDRVEITETEGVDAFYSLLSLKKIELDYEASDWEEAVREAGKLLYEDGAVEKQYIEGMVSNIKKNGPYVVIYPGIAVPHSDTEMGVIKEAASIVRLKTPVKFYSEINDPVKYIIGLSIMSAQSINRAIYDMTMIFGNEEIKNELDNITEIKDMLNTIKRIEIQCNKEDNNGTNRI